MTKRFWCVVAAVVATGCGLADLRLTESQLTANAPFVQVARGAITGVPTDGGLGSDVSANNDTFYVAINKAELGQKWFLSAFLSQWAPAESVQMRSLGTRVVSFKVQNGKLFVFDVATGKGWSDTLDPTVVIEAYPVVTTDATFNALANASNYVLFDPSAGLNRFSFVSDDQAQSGQRFQVDLAYLQRFRELSDGVSFEEVFTGYSESPGVGAADQPFRGSGTLEVSLRRYHESPGFVAKEWTSSNYFHSSNVQYVPNEPRVKANSLRWNIAPGMTPISWSISKEVAAYATDPRLAGIDLPGAIARGVTGWNQAFGFPVFQVVPASDTEGLGDDEKNQIIFDRNPAAGYAFANWRENPNTGEIRGASVYFSAAFVEGALSEAGSPPDAGSGDLCALLGIDCPDAGAPPPTDAGSGDLCALLGIDCPDAGAPPPTDAGTGDVTCAPSVVISQVFGGNGATYAQDFVELHNRSASTVLLTGWSVQYGSASGTNWQVASLTGSIAPGGYYLVGFAGQSDGGGFVPVRPDQSFSINLSASSGKVALVASTVALSGSCPAGAVDLVGYGSANCSEQSAGPTGSSALALVRRDAAACVDSNVNSADFVTQAPAPRNALAMPSPCTCTSPGPLADGGVSPVTPAVGADGGVLLVPPSATHAARLSWDAMPHDDVCALGRQTKVAMPAGMTRRDFVEAVVTHAVLHEIGHTLGLRHNFRGSLTSSSVMDYLRDDDGARMTTPGAYDVAAVKYLYGLDLFAPMQPFCTDEDRFVAGDCTIFDSGPTPLTSDVGPAYTAKVRSWLAGQTPSLALSALFPVTRYVRGPATEAQRLEAFNVLVGQVAPPLPADVAALGPNATALADALTGAALANLFLDPAGLRDELQVDPNVLDNTFRARVIEVAKNVLINSDHVRGFAQRRVAVDVLKALQAYDAYQALLEARGPLANERATYNPLGQALVDDLSRRIDLAVSPYFR